MTAIDQFFSVAKKSRDPHEELIAYRDSIFLAKEKKLSEVELEELRKNTWKVFAQALERAFSPRRIEAICKRYHVNLQKFAECHPPLPLRCRHLDFFAVGSAKIHDQDLMEEGGDLYQKTPQELKALYQKADRLYFFHELKLSENLQGIVKFLLQFLLNSELSQDCERIRCYREIESPVRHRHGYLQRLTMRIISSEPEEGEIVPALDKNNAVDYYKVYRIVAAKGLYAVALLPVSHFSLLPFLLVFRATRTQLYEMDCIDSWRNNMEKCIGSLGYTLAKKKIDALMRDPIFCPQGKKIMIAAYSLGGAHAGYFCLDYWRFVSEAVFFNTVSNSDAAVAEKLAQEINQLPLDQPGPSLYIYRAKGDWAHFLGHKHAGWGISHPKSPVEVQEFHIRKFPKLVDIHFLKMLHSFRFLDEREDPYEKYKVEVFRKSEQVDRELDNAKRDRNMHLEELRSSFQVQVFYQALNAAYCCIMIAFRFFGISLLKTSDP